MLPGYTYILCARSEAAQSFSPLMHTHGPRSGDPEGMSMRAHTSRRQRLTNITGVRAAWVEQRERHAGSMARARGDLPDETRSPAKLPVKLRLIRGCKGAAPRR